MNTYVIPRQDLLASPINFTGFIADKVLPSLNVMQWSGSRPMAAANVTTTAGGRDGNGNVLGTSRTANLVSFDISRTGSGEIIDRQTVGVEQIQMWGTKEAAERVLAQTGLLRIKTSIEVAVRAALAADPVDISGVDLMGGLLSAVQSMKGYGKVAIAGSYAALNSIRALDAVKSRMSATGTSSDAATRSITNAQLAEIFTADEVIQAESPGTPIWTATELVVLVKADPTLDPAQVPQVGRFFNYTWVLEGQNSTITCEELYNPATRDSVLDFLAYGKPYLANTAFKTALKIG
jgi:hypothetical protein